jgi:hypothetical protein
MSSTGFCTQLVRASALLVAVARVAVPSLLAWGLMTGAYANAGCTVATLHGPYGLSQTGSITGAGPVAVAGIIVFDGAGNSTANVMVSINGAAFPASPTATYKVNSDCTATISLIDGETLFGAIVSDGRELRFINATEGFLGAAGVAKKVSNQD